MATLADVIDPFTAPQGPYSVGPNEHLTLEQGLVFTPSVLGSLRIVSIGVGDEAQPGSTAAFEIGGGTFSCTLDFPSAGNELNAGGCASIYDRDDGPVFDLSGSQQFLLDVQSVDGGMTLSVSMTDANGGDSWALIEGVTAGQLTIPFADMIPLFGGGADPSIIDIIDIGVINQAGQEGKVVLGAVSTDGAIREGPILPSDDEIVAEEIPGTYYNPDRDGEGCQLTLERDQVTFILTCYFYKAGEQFWVIGVGFLVDGEISFGELTITQGADYGDAFDPDDVVRTPWGLATMSFSDCNNAELQLLPLLAGYEALTLALTRIVPTVCGGGGVPGEAFRWMGAYYDPDRDGEGFHFGVEAGEIFVMTWYTYLNGKQVWLIGTGQRNGNRIVFSDVVITHGADFGSNFNPDDVIRESFGRITVDISNCNNFMATVNSDLPEFQDLMLNVTKIVPGACP